MIIGGSAFRAGTCMLIPLDRVFSAPFKPLVLIIPPENGALQLPKTRSNLDPATD
jgi:hypothetical protein